MPDTLPGKVFKIPKKNLGRMILEAQLKAALVACNPLFFFDVGGRLNIPHPFMNYRQGVFFDGWPAGGKHVCSLDRGWPMEGMVPEVPVYSTVRDLVELPADSLDPLAEDIWMPLLHRPGWVQVNREVRSDVILCGWRHTLEKVIAAKIEGATRGDIGAKLGIEWRDRVEGVSVPEEGPAPWETGEYEDDGHVLEEMGSFEARPTIILTGA